MELDDVQQMLISTVRRLATEKIEPIAGEIEKKGEYPHQIWEWFKENDLIGLPFPEEYGGSGMGMTTYCLVLEELAKVCNNSSSILITQYLGSKPILIGGSEEQKKKYIPSIASGEIKVAFALTEPNAGSDVGSMRSTAVKDGDHYIINGTKCFISNADVAQVICVFAKTDTTKGHKGISAFVVPTDTPGFSIGKVEDKMGGKPIHACELILEDVRIPQENLLGEEGQGFKIAMEVLNQSRVSIAARVCGLAQGALDYAVEYTKQRVQFGQPLAKNQGLQFMIADMAIEIEAARQLAYRACQEVDQEGPEIAKYGAMAKCFATDMAMKVTTDAVQLLGGYGYMEEYPLSRKMRDAKLAQIIEGTNQIQRIVVASTIIGRI